jgi:hypothetical protein
MFSRQVTAWCDGQANDPTADRIRRALRRARPGRAEGSWTTVGGRAVVVWLLTLVGCTGPAPPARTEGLVRWDSSGVHVVEHVPLDLSLNVLEPGPPSLRIGALDGPAENLLFGVQAATRLSDGAFALINAGTNEVRIYEASGRHRATFGGAGQGLSELRRPLVLVVLPGDTLQVQDYVGSDYHDRVYFAPDGSFVRRATTDRTLLAGFYQDIGMISLGALWLSDDFLLLPVYDPDLLMNQSFPRFRPPTTLLRASEDLVEVDTLGGFAGYRQQWVDLGGERGAVQVFFPFSPRSSWSISPTGGTIVVGDNATTQFHLFGQDGTRTIVRWEAEPEPISDAEIDVWIEERVMQSDPSRRALVRRALSALDASGVKPYYEDLRLGSDGSIWLTARGSGTDSSRMIVFEADGGFRGNVVISAAHRFLNAGADWVAALVRDEYDVEYVEVYPLRPSG